MPYGLGNTNRLDTETALVEAAFPDLVTVAGDGDTAVADFVGEYTQADDGRYQFVDGPLVVAMTEGRVLFVDDATLISPKVLAVVYPAMDGRRQLAVKAQKGRDDHRQRGLLRDRRLCIGGQCSGLADRRVAGSEAVWNWRGYGLAVSRPGRWCWPR